MKIKNIYGFDIKKSFSKYRIDWEKSISIPQKRIKDIIRPFWEGQDVYEEMYIPGSKLRIDLINFTQMLAIEVSPKHHRQYNEFFHKNRSSFLAALNRDLKKIQWCEANNIKCIEIEEDDLKKQDQEILDLIV